MTCHIDGPPRTIEAALALLEQCGGPNWLGLAGLGLLTILFVMLVAFLAVPILYRWLT
jgi:hypothetical protein